MHFPIKSLCIKSSCGARDAFPFHGRLGQFAFGAASLRLGRTGVRELTLAGEVFESGAFAAMHESGSGLLRPRAMSAFPPLSGIERISVGQPFNQYTAYLFYPSNSKGSVAPTRHRDEIQTEADIISLHCPLTPQTHHIVNAHTPARMKKGALLITSRGGLVDTQAVIEALKSGRLGGVAIDVYEQEASLFFKESVGRGDRAQGRSVIQTQTHRTRSLVDDVVGRVTGSLFDAS